MVEGSGVLWTVGGDKACYIESRDKIRIPHPKAYYQPIDWNRTALHELCHMTGSKTRLARDLRGEFGSEAYAREELVAELGSAFLCAALGIVPSVRHADYLGDWLAVIRGDDRAIFKAASAASKAADWLMTLTDQAPGGPAAAA